MASNYYGLNAGQNADKAVVASSTNSTDVEVRYDTTNVTSREALLIALENLANFIRTSKFPPV